jgi:hypothetical protein
MRSLCRHELVRAGRDERLKERGTEREREEREGGRESERARESER